MAGYIKNIPTEEVFSLTEQVGYLPGQAVSRTISQNDEQSLTIFAFDKREEISSHSSHGDGLITELDGEGKITIDGRPFILHKGESILMPAGKPHAVFAQEKFKMYLAVIFSLPKKTKIIGYFQQGPCCGEFKGCGLKATALKFSMSVLLANSPWLEKPQLLQWLGAC